MPEIIFLTLAEAVEIHADQIERYGGAGGTLDIGLLESALSMPEVMFAGEYLHHDLLEMAAAYAFHICQNHPFADGNKRTALACALVFLEINGMGLLDPKGEFYSAIMDVASGKVDKHSLAEVFRRLPLAK